MQLNTTPNKGSRRPRIVGLDVARALAIIGMVYAHLAPPHGVVGELTTGIPSALFAVLAGISMGLIGKPGNIAVRGIVLIILGVALQPLSGTIMVVLTALGVGFVVLHRTPRWSTRTLALLTAVAAVLSVAIHTYVSTTENYTVLAMLVTGGYPIFTWITYLLVGLVSGRLIVDKRKAWGPTLAVGALLAAGGLALRGFDLPAALDASAHSGGLVDLITTSGAALAVIAACLLTAGGWAAPLQAFGSMSLTMYIAHVLTAGRLLTVPVQPWYPAAATTTVLAGIACAMVWKMLAGKRGPAEWVMAQLAGLPGRGTSRTARTTTAKVAATSAAALALMPGPAHALDNAEPATGPEAETVARMYFSTSRGVECTATAIADRWLLTAHHCIEGVPEPAGHVTFGNDGATRDVAFDTAIHAPGGDIALLHTTEPIGLEHYPLLADDTPTQGAGTIYGWSEEGMGRTGILPQATATITEIAEISLYGEGGQTVLSQLEGGAYVQGGDSGGPLFVNGAVAGVATAGIGANPGNQTSSQAAHSPVAERVDWIRKQIAHDELLPETLAAQNPLPAPVHDISWWWALAAGLAVVAAAVPYYRRGGHASGRVSTAA